MLTGFLQGNWRLLLFSQSLLFVTNIYHFLKTVGRASADLSRLQLSFLLCQTLQFEMTKAWQQRQVRSGGCRSQADPHKCSKAWHSFAGRKLYEGYLHHTTPQRWCLYQAVLSFENTLLFYHIWVSSKCRSLRPFCGAHLGLFWDNNVTYWMTNVPRN